MKENLFAFLFLVWLLAVTAVVGYQCYDEFMFRVGVGQYAQRTDKSIQDIVGFLNEEIRKGQEFNEKIKNYKHPEQPQKAQ